MMKMKMGALRAGALCMGWALALLVAVPVTASNFTWGEERFIAHVEDRARAGDINALVIIAQARNPYQGGTYDRYWPETRMVDAYFDIMLAVDRDDYIVGLHAMTVHMLAVPSRDLTQNYLRMYVNRGNQLMEGAREAGEFGGDMNARSAHFSLALNQAIACWSQVNGDEAEAAKIMSGVHEQFGRSNLTLGQGGNPCDARKNTLRGLKGLPYQFM